MIANGLDPKELHDKYRRATPFPHIVIDNFFDPNVAAELAQDLELIDIESWHRDEHPDQMRKASMEDLSLLPTSAARALGSFNSPEVVAFIETLTGIADLIPDPQLLGGGVHVTSPGGLLSVHADFNLHPNSGFHRRVNALLFLNRDWDPNWNGQLELWPEDLSAPAKLIDPIQNRLAVFTITDTAFHGMPRTLQCPPDRKRFSLALYYYTLERPEAEKAPFHWAAWQQTDRAR